MQLEAVIEMSERDKSEINTKKKMIFPCVFSVSSIET